MGSAQHLNDIAERLRANGQDVGTADLPGGAAFVGYRADFRVQWVASRLHLFTICLAVPAITGPGLERFARDALEYAVQRKGARRELQSGVAAIPVVLAEQVGETAVAVAHNEIVMRRAAFAWPAVVETSNGTIYRHEGAVFRGGVYAKWMRKQTSGALGG